MERMWRKVNQGLTNTTSTLLKQSRHNSSNNNSNRNSNSHYGDGTSAPANHRQSSASMCADDIDGPVYANVPQYNRGWGYIDTSKCRKRRRKVKSRRNSSSKDKHSKAKNADKSKGTNKETSLRERAVAKLKILNFNINWDVHMKPCGSRVNTNILTRRLCRNRSCDDNELYRSNSFKFERFRRDDNDAAAAAAVNTLPKQVNICDDYSLPVDFVKKRPSSLEHCRDVKFADDFPSPSIVNEQVIQNPSIKETRPLSTASTSTGPKVLLNYCEPKDTKKPKHRKSAAKSIKYTSDSSLPNSTDEDIRAESKYDSSESVADSFFNLNEPEYANQERPRPLPPLKPNDHQQQHHLNSNTIGASPYYYSDLLSGNKGAGSANTQRSLKSTVTTTSTAPKKYRSFLDDPPTPPSEQLPSAHNKKRAANLQKRHSITERDVNRCDTFSSTTSDDSNCTECRKRRELRVNLPSRDESFGATCDEYEEREEVPSPAPNECCNYNPASHLIDEDDDDAMPPHRLLGHAGCICAAPGETNNDDETGEYRSQSIFYVHQGEDGCADCTINKIDDSFQYDSDMANKRRIEVYETAFDSTTCEPEQKCDIEERIRNIMLMDRTQFAKSNESDDGKANIQQFNCDYHKNRHLSENTNVASSCNSSSSKNLAATAMYTTHSPPSTAPMPVKFPNQHDQMHYRDSIRSAPNLPQNTPHHMAGNDTSQGDSRREAVNDRKIPLKKSGSRQQHKKCSHGAVPDRVMQLRQSKRRTHQPRNPSGAQKYSSTESITSSSGSGSMESLHSSVSDGNRSSISSGSRNSASLSSHSSDSGARVRYPLRTPVIVHANMNILSPISDKSIQEPFHDGAAEFAAGGNRKSLQLFSENTAASTAAKEFGKQISVDMMLLENQKMQKRRYLQNRASLLLKDEIQGSDSGISLQSRDESKTKSLVIPNFNGGQQQQSQIQPQQAAQSAFANSGLSMPEDMANLPFDMPKLRRNLLSEQKQNTSGSATSVDLGDLPFDMPKLNRRLHAQALSTETPPTAHDPNTMSNASSSQSIREDNRFGSGRKNLSLQFNRSSLLKNEGLPSERGLHLNLFSAKNTFDIDASIPLDRQNWYHGALTRIEAESTLRPLLEGSFLVRNCESARNDYSLSLKSAKGFMHMRIQQNDTGQFILGEFSQPFDSVPDIIKHFCLNRLPVRGAEHMCLIAPVEAQLL